MPETIIETHQLQKEFVRDEFHVVALKDVDITIAKGEFIGLIDRKSTRLNSSHIQKSRMPSSA